MKLFVPSLLMSLASLAPAGDLLVSPDWLKSNLNDPRLVLFHVGTKAEFQKEHIPGAQHVVPQDLSIPRVEGALMFELLPPEALRQKLESLGVSDASRVIVYFGSDMVAPTTRVYWSLDVAGLGDNASVLDGGLPAWKAAGGGVTDALMARPPGRITRAPRPDLLIAAEEIQAGLGSDTFNLVDSRLTEFFEGTNPGSMPRAGRIPGARSVPFQDLLTPELTMKSEAETADLFAARGIKAGDTVVSYCHTGQQATLVYFAAKRLGIRARLYDGSWDEWSRRSELPVEKSPAK